jgi:hypothetical protein
MNDWPPMTLELIEICQELDCMTKAWDEASKYHGKLQRSSLQRHLPSSRFKWFACIPFANVHLVIRIISIYCKLDRSKQPFSFSSDCCCWIQFYCSFHNHLLFTPDTLHDCTKTSKSAAKDARVDCVTHLCRPRHLKSNITMTLISTAFVM